MADKYVKLDDVIDTLEYEWGYEGMREDSYNLPTADVEEVRHGRDVGDMNDRDDWYEPVHICSICDCAFMMDFEEEAHCCPNCGAKMDGGEDA